MVILTVKLRAKLKALCSKSHPDEMKEGRLVLFDVCSLCGESELAGTKPSDYGFDVALADPGHRCEKCEDVARRAPEIFKWVLNVISFQWDQDEVPV